MSNSPSIAVIIPTLNRPELIERCIKSIHNQTFKGMVTCIVVDSSSDNKTEILVKNFDITNKNFQLNYLKNNESLNPIDNWTYAIDSLSTDYSKFICDDDWLEDNFFDECIRIFEEHSVDCVVSNIAVHKEFSKNKEIIKGYYKYEEGIPSKVDVVNSFLGLSNILPVTPTASLMKTEKLIESFYSSLKHIECTKYLFGFDFHMSYFSVFNGSGTYLIQKDLVNSWAGDDSMTLNVKKAKISYCYFYSLLKLIEISDFSITDAQKRIISHKLSVIKIKSLFNREYKKIILPTKIKSKLVISKIIKDLIKKIYIKFLYKYIKN